MRRNHLHRHVIETLERFGYRIDASKRGLAIVEAMPDDKLLALIRDRGGNGACGGMSTCVSQERANEQG